MPESTQMHVQWITVNGQSVPLVLPQYWDGEKWVISSEQNPLPVKAELTKPVQTELTGSIVAEDYLTGVEVAPGSTVYTDILNFRGTRLGVGIRFSFQGPHIDFEVRFEPAGKNISFVQTSTETIVISKTSNYRGTGSVILNTPRGRFHITNQSNETAILEGITITEFMASGNGGTNQ